MALDRTSIDPAEYIARHWYEDMELIVSGVDFGECMTYDVLQVVNRAVIQTEAEEKKE